MSFVNKISRYTQVISIDPWHVHVNILIKIGNVQLVIFLIVGYYCLFHSVHAISRLAKFNVGDIL